MAASREELYAISADNQPKRNKIVRRQAGKIRRSEYYKNPYQTNSRPDQRRPAIEKSHLRQWVCFGLAAAIWVAAQRLARPDLNAATPHVGLEPKLSIAAHGLKGREPCNAAIGPGKIGLLRSLVGGLRAAARRHQARLSPHVIWQRSGGGPQCGPSRVCQTRNRVLAPNGPGTSTS